MNGVRLLPLDGAETIGGSKLLLEYDDSRILFDFGTNFHAMNKYYEEFLKPRVACGILDYVAMGVLPDVRGLYRDDLLHPDVLLTGPEIGKVDAVLVSHAHIDHTGALGFLKQEVPIIAVQMTAAIAKAMQDSQMTGLGMDGMYSMQRVLCEFRGAPVIKSPREEKEMLGRDLCVADGDPSEGFRSFWSSTPAQMMGSAKGKLLVPGDIMKSIPGVEFTAFPVDHSIKGATGYVVKTSKGSVVYTGDVRIHGLEGAKTLEFAERAKGSDPYALIIEGTTIGRSPGQVTEEEVEKRIGKIVSESQGEFLVADFGPRNIERLEIVLRAAKENGRKLVVLPKDAYLLSAMNIVDPSIPVPGNDMLIYDCPKGQCQTWEEWALDKRFPDTTVKPADITKAPGNYILAFSFWDIKHLVDLKPKGGRYIYSSSEAYSEEQEIDFVRLAAWLEKFGIKREGFTFKKDGKPDFPKGLHASGHASAVDIKKIVEIIDPDVVIPVHTESPKWFEETFTDRKVMLPVTGQWIDL